MASDEKVFSPILFLNEQADLFAISDRPVLQGLHLYREEELAMHQEINGTSVPLQGATRDNIKRAADDIMTLKREK